jgi:hypothetical protein
VDEQALGTPDRKLGWVLVEVDIHSGLLETLEIQWRDQLFSHRLDYLGLPFRCTRCHKTGHLKNTYPGRRMRKSLNLLASESFLDVSRLLWIPFLRIILCSRHRTHHLFWTPTHFQVRSSLFVLLCFSL